MSEPRYLRYAALALSLALIAGAWPWLAQLTEVLP